MLSLFWAVKHHFFILFGSFWWLNAGRSWFTGSLLKELFKRVLLAVSLGGNAMIFFMVPSGFQSWVTSELLHSSIQPSFATFCTYVFGEYFMTLMQYGMFSWLLNYDSCLSRKKNHMWCLVPQRRGCRCWVCVGWTPGERTCWRDHQVVAWAWATEYVTTCHYPMDIKRGYEKCVFVSNVNHHKSSIDRPFFIVMLNKQMVYLKIDDVSPQWSKRFCCVHPLRAATNGNPQLNHTIGKQYTDDLKLWGEYRE